MFVDIIKCLFYTDLLQKRKLSTTYANVFRAFWLIVDIFSSHA